MYARKEIQSQSMTMNDISTSLLVVNASQTVNLPSCDELTRRRLSRDQSNARILP